jgi:transforming growth factor-beta-induced protein
LRGVGLIPTESPSAASCESIAEVLLGNIDTFSTLVEFAFQADLASVLGDTEAEIYIAAPTNDAFDAFGELEPEIVSNLMTDEWKTHLQSLLLYHTVESGAFSERNDDDDTSSVTLTTLNGEDITITYTDDRNVFINNDASVVDDFVACESLVDVIDKVLIPSWVENSIVDRAIADEELSILVNLVVQAELAEILSSSGPYTVLAPSNDAFRELLASPSIDPSNVDINLIKGLLTFHVIDGIYSADEIVDGLELATLQGDAVVFAVDGDVVTVNGSLVTDVDILANNGIIHKIDGVLIPNISIPVVETPDESPSVAAPSETETLGTIVDVASADEDLSILVDAVVHAGLADTLSSAGPFTVFAPTDAVWTKALTNPEDITVLDADILKEILLYHTVAGTYTAADITDGLILTTVQGETIEFSIDGDVVMINDEVMVTGTDILASNGIIHTIDGILFPQAVLDPTEGPSDPTKDPSEIPGTIVDVASADEDLSILVEAVVHAGLVDTLSSAGPFTVFAPTNDVWTEGLTNPDDITVLDPEILKQVLLYHTVAGTYTAADITDGLILTTVQGETIEFSIDGDVVMINGNVMITETDILASNGVIHTVDNFLFPQSTEPTTEDPSDPVSAPSKTETLGTIVDVASADEDLSILVEAVVHAGLVDTLSSAGPFTVFAPTNAVWTEALANPEDITELDVDILTEVLLYHTVAGTYTAADITDGLILTTVQGETIEFSIDGDAVMINGNVMITGTDILASNGVIHTIDGILFPQANEPEDAPMVSPNEPTEATTGTKNETSSEPTGTIIDVASGEDDLSILVNLIVQAGLVETLSSEGRFTVFAPTNSAFTTVFNDLGLDATDLGDVVDSEALSSILTYHVVAGIYKASDIIDGLTLTTVQGDTIEFGVSSDGVVTVNNEVISVTDIPASNGVIHTIAGVLFPGTV